MSATCICITTQVAACCERIERGLTLMGATAVEDKLQVGEARPKEILKSPSHVPSRNTSLGSCQVKCKVKAGVSEFQRGPGCPRPLGSYARAVAPQLASCVFRHAGHLDLKAVRAPLDWWPVLLVHRSLGATNVHNHRTGSRRP
jgi:hypothetical protein